MNHSTSSLVSQSDKQKIARIMLFLYSDLEYEWPKHPLTGLKRFATTVFSFGLLPRYFDKRWKSSGDFEIWPFIRRSDFERCKDNPDLLRGYGT